MQNWPKAYKALLQNYYFTVFSSKSEFVVIYTVLRYTREFCSGNIVKKISMK